MSGTPKEQADRKNQGKPRVGLIDAYFQEELAKVLTMGAKKYSKYKDCTCYVKFVEQIESMLENYVVDTTSNGYVPKTQNTQSDNGKTAGSGTQETSTQPMKDVGNISQPHIKKNENVLKGLCANMDCLRKKLIIFLQHAESVEARNVLQLITAMKPESSEVDCAILATSDLVLLKDQINGLKKHSSICESREVLISGANNWRKGMSWTEVLDSLERHVLYFKSMDHELT